MPTSVRNRLDGKNDMIFAAVSPASSVPARKAPAKASTPILTGKIVATTNMATSPKIEISSCDMACLPRPAGDARMRNPSARRARIRCHIHWRFLGAIGFMSARVRSSLNRMPSQLFCIQ